MAKKRPVGFWSVHDDTLRAGLSSRRPWRTTDFESLVCEEGAQVLQRAEAGAVSLLLLDYRIGTPDGVEIVKDAARAGNCDCRSS
jgi:DNA-binding response OmpR family regulator